MLRCETAGPEDISVIYDLSKALIHEYEDIASIDYDKVLAWVYRKIENNIGQYSCVYENGQKVGYYRTADEDGRTELDDLYVLPTFRNRGIGTRILGKITAEAKLPVFLYVFKGNTGAIRLYERSGFSIEREVGTTRLIMVRNG